jgi:hypothetical protein
MAQLWLAMEDLRSRTISLVQEWKILQHSHDGLLNHIVNIAPQRDSDGSTDGAKANLGDLVATMTDHKKKVTYALKKFFSWAVRTSSFDEPRISWKVPCEDAPNVAIKLKMFDWIKRETKNVQAVDAEDWLRPAFVTFVRTVGNQVGESSLLLRMICFSLS